MSRPTIREAAQQLKICDRKLYAALRSAGITGSNNLARPDYIREGFFVNEIRGFHLRGTRIKKQYPVSCVTAAGMSLLQEFADELRRPSRLSDSHETDRETTQRAQKSISCSNRFRSLCGAQQ